MDYVIKIGVFVAVGLVLNRIVNLIYKFASKKTNSIHLRFSRSTINVVIDIILIYSLAQQFEVTKDISKALLQSGSLIVAIATFAAQQTLANVISGISISASKPYDVEQKVRVIQGGTVIAEGMVKDITMRHTIISQFNGESCIVPNSVMDSAVVINSNYTENIGNFVEIVISFDSDLEKAIEIMKKICAEDERTFNTYENPVTVSGYTQNGAVLKTTIWCRTLNDSFLACSDIRVALIKEFKENGIRIPYQTMTIYQGN